MNPKRFIEHINPSDVKYLLPKSKWKSISFSSTQEKRLRKIISMIGGESIEQQNELNSKIDSISSTQSTQSTKSKSKLNEKSTSKQDHYRKFISNFQFPSRDDIQFLNQIDRTKCEKVESILSSTEIDSSILPSNDLNNELYQLDNVILDIQPEYYKSKSNEDENDETKSNENYETKSNENERIDLRTSTFNSSTLDQHHNILVHKFTKGQLIQKHPDKLKIINQFISSPITNRVIQYFTTFNRFGLLNEYFSTHYFPLEYRVTKNKNQIRIESGEKLKHPFVIQRIPDSIKTIIRNVTYYFKDIVNELKYDNRGYYVLEYNGMTIPIICRHLYMLLSGIPLRQISIECSRKGLCKYCGDVLVNESFEDTTILPRKVPEISYRLIESFYGDVDDGNFYLIIYNQIASTISRFVTSDDQDYINRSNAIAGLYAYAILVEGIKRNCNLKNVPSSLRLFTECCYIIGWDEERMKELINVEKLFGSVDAMVDKLVHGLVKHVEKNNIDEVFNQFSSNEIKKLKTNNQLQLLRDRIRTIIFKYDSQPIPQIDELKSSFKSILSNDQCLNCSGLLRTKYNTFELFKSISLNVCLENGIHNFTNQSPNQSTKNPNQVLTCKFCGLKSDLSNVELIYQKYSSSFSNKYDMDVKKSRIISTNNWSSEFDLDKILNEVREESLNQYLLSKLDINNKQLDEINSNLQSHLEMILNSINTCLKWNLNVYDCKLRTTDLLKIIVFIDQNRLNDFILTSLKLIPNLKSEIII